MVVSGASGRTIGLASAALCLALAVSCGGVELEPGVTAGASGESGTGGATRGVDAGRGTTLGGIGGRISGPVAAGGMIGHGGRTVNGRGGAGGVAGARPTKGDSTGAGVGGLGQDDGQAGGSLLAGRGGDSSDGAGGMAGAAGEPGIAATGCENGGDYSERKGGTRCESAESYAQGPNYERIEGATTSSDCLEACSARTDCTAVSDYLGMRPAAGCSLFYADCDILTRPFWGEEDGMMRHEKVCDDSGCTFERIPGFYGCGDELTEGISLETAESIDDCKAACLDDPACTAIGDYFYGQGVPGCYLNLGSCDAPFLSYQDGALYVKCE